MNWLTKIATTLGPRIVGGVASLAAGWIFAKTKGAIQVDPTQVVEIAGTMIGTYAAIHRGTSALVNPGDAASGTLVQVEKDVKAEVKAQEENAAPPPPSNPNSFNRPGSL